MSEETLRAVIVALCLFWTGCGFGLGWITHSMRSLGDSWDVRLEDDDETD